MRRQNRRRVGSDAEESGMSETDLAGEAHQQIEPQHDDGVDRHAVGDIEIVGVREQQREHQQDGGERKQTGVPACHTRSVSLAPNRPRGMKNRTMKISRKGAASL